MRSGLCAANTMTMSNREQSVRNARRHEAELRETGDDARGGRRCRTAACYVDAGMPDVAAQWYLDAALHAESCEQFYVPLLHARAAAKLDPTNASVQSAVRRLTARYAVE